MNVFGTLSFFTEIKEMIKMYDLNYANIVSTLAMLVGGASLGWQIYTWKEQKELEEEALFKVYIKKTKTEKKDNIAPFFLSGCEKTFIIKNTGKRKVKLLSVSIDSVPIESCKFLKNPGVFINTEIPPDGAMTCPVLPSYNFSNDLIGKKVLINCELSSGKIIPTQLSLYEEQG